MRISIDDMAINQLFETLLWQATDEEGTPLDYLGYTRDDIDRDSQNALIGQFQSFIMSNRVDVEAYMAHTGRTMDDVAHDYILTANGHGTGFWDRCYCGIDQSDYPAERLSEMARIDGDINAWVGDNGVIDITL